MVNFLRDELRNLATETFEIVELSDLGLTAADASEFDDASDLAIGWTSSSCSCSSCCSCSTSSCCSTSTSTGCGG